MKKLLDFQYQSFEIIAKEELAPQTFLFRLAGHIDFEPGQFVQLKLDHFGEITVAICSNPKEKKYFELCVRASGSTSNEIVKLLPGDKVDLRGPYGNGWPIQFMTSRNLVLVAGGMGMVPIRSALLLLEQKKILFGKVFIYTGFKTEEQVLFVDDLKRWSKKFTVHVSVEYADKNFWGEKGLITEPIKKEPTINEKSLVLMCGPDPMYHFCNEIFAKKEVKKENIYISYERRMECGIGICQHCSCGKFLVCQDGPVFRLDQIEKEVGK